MQETKEGFLGEVPDDLQNLCKIMELRCAEIGIYQMEEIAEAAAGVGIMEKRVLLDFQRV